MGLIGNKTDLEHQRIIKIENHNKVAEEYALEPYYSNFGSYLLSALKLFFYFFFLNCFKDFQDRETRF